MKYHQPVHIVTRKHLSEAMQEYPDAANEIKAWVPIVEGVRWHNFAEVRLMFRDADYIDGYVVFNTSVRQDSSLWDRPESTKDYRAPCPSSSHS